VYSVNFAAKLVHTRRAFSSTVIDSHQETVSGQACDPPDPHGYFIFPLVEEIYGTRYQGGSFSVINVGSDFHCLRRYSFLFWWPLAEYTAYLLQVHRFPLPPPHSPQANQV